MRVIKYRGCFKLEVNNCSGMTRSVELNDSLKPWVFLFFFLNVFQKPAVRTGRGEGWGGRPQEIELYISEREQSFLQIAVQIHSPLCPAQNRLPESCEWLYFFHQHLIFFPPKNKHHAIQETVDKAGFVSGFY